MKITKPDPNNWEVSSNGEPFGWIKKVYLNGKKSGLYGFENSIKTMNGKPYFGNFKEAKSWMVDVLEELEGVEK